MEIPFVRPSIQLGTCLICRTTGEEAVTVAPAVQYAMGAHSVSVIWSSGAYGRVQLDRVEVKAER